MANSLGQTSDLKLSYQDWTISYILYSGKTDLPLISPKLWLESHQTTFLLSLRICNFAGVPILTVSTTITWNYIVLTKMKRIGGILLAKLVSSDIPSIGGSNNSPIK